MAEPRPGAQVSPPVSIYTEPSLEANYRYKYFLFLCLSIASDVAALAQTYGPTENITSTK